eukprot:TRINITY_DN1986_c0_g1_i1.p1 TRINITY_DN1986_c0_g1~~TRINITY_DN1986_c0_g1_i1.p1  ORF type:complete len:285 (-),score=73.49 TRINITY_DN1986_c0_g1_i1:1015-1812(-)
MGKKRKNVPERPIADEDDGDSKFLKFNDSDNDVDMNVDDAPQEQLNPLQLAIHNLASTLGLTFDGSSKSPFPKSVVFPSAKELARHAANDAVVDAVAQTASTTLDALREAIMLRARMLSSKANAIPGFLTDDDAFLQTLYVDSGLPINKRYAEMALWRYVVRTNHKLAGQVRDVLMTQQQSDGGGAAVAAAADAPSGAFRDFMSQLTAVFGDELNILRQEPDFDDARVKQLVEALGTTDSLLSQVERELSSRSVVAKGKPIHSVQ